MTFILPVCPHSLSEWWRVRSPLSSCFMWVVTCKGQTYDFCFWIILWVIPVFSIISIIIILVACSVPQPGKVTVAHRGYSKSSLWPRTPLPPSCLIWQFCPEVLSDFWRSSISSISQLLFQLSKGMDVSVGGVTNQSVQVALWPWITVSSLWTDGLCSNSACHGSRDLSVMSLV